MRKSRVKAEGEHVHRDPDDDPKVKVTKGKARVTDCYQGGKPYCKQQPLYVHTDPGGFHFSTAIQ